MEEKSKLDVWISDPTYSSWDEKETAAATV